MKKISSVLAIILILASFGFSQNNNETIRFFKKKGYEEGFVVFDNGEVFKGQLRRYSTEASCGRIKAKDSSGTTRIFWPKQVNYYKRGNEYFVKKKIVFGFKVFMKVVISGKLTLYAYCYKTSSMSSTMSSPFTSSYTISYSSRGIDYYLGFEEKFFKINGFKKIMIDFFTNYAPDKELVEKIKNKELKYRDIQTIVNEYNKKHITIKNIEIEK